MIYAFATAPDFGPTPQCNVRTYYVLFDIDVPATKVVFRFIFIADLALLAIGTVLTFMFAQRIDPDGEVFTVEAQFKGVDVARLVVEVLGRCYIIAMTEVMLWKNASSQAAGD